MENSIWLHEHIWHCDAIYDTGPKVYRPRSFLIPVVNDEVEYCY